MKSAGLTPKDMAMQLALIQEYVWNKVTPGDDSQVWCVLHHVDDNVLGISVCAYYPSIYIHLHPYTHRLSL